MTTVLIVDDHPTFRATARMLLEAEGYDVVGEAPDGTSGIAAAWELHPDGFSVAQRITANQGAPAVVLTSSRDSSDFGPLVAGSGARGFISKGELSGAAIAELL
jgi:DNA-binding NarL/FixJ family response regulator